MTSPRSPKSAKGSWRGARSTVPNALRSVQEKRVPPTLHERMEKTFYRKQLREQRQDKNYLAQMKSEKAKSRFYIREIEEFSQKVRL